VIKPVKLITVCSKHNSSSSS